MKRHLTLLCVNLSVRLDPSSVPLHVSCGILNDTPPSGESYYAAPPPKYGLMERQWTIQYTCDLMPIAVVTIMLAVVQLPVHQ